MSSSSWPTWPHIPLEAILRAYPNATRFVLRMRQTSPDYGSHPDQEYQIKHLHDAQVMQPCGEDHEHHGGCYSRDTWDAVTRDYRKRNTK